MGKLVFLKVKVPKFECVSLVEDGDDCGDDDEDIYALDGDADVDVCCWFCCCCCCCCWGCWGCWNKRMDSLVFTTTMFD